MFLNSSPDDGQELVLPLFELVHYDPSLNFLNGGRGK